MNCRICKTPIRADRDFCDTCVWTVAREVEQQKLEKLVSLSAAQLEPGQLYCDGDPTGDCFYILARVDGLHFAAIGLIGGNRWTIAPCKSPAEAVAGLTWFNGNITVTPK